jgi:hypothetical protein
MPVASLTHQSPYVVDSGSFSISFIRVIFGPENTLEFLAFSQFDDEQLNVIVKPVPSTVFFRQKAFGQSLPE